MDQRFGTLETSLAALELRLTLRSGSLMVVGVVAVSAPAKLL